MVVIIDFCQMYGKFIEKIVKIVEGHYDLY